MGWAWQAWADYFVLDDFTHYWAHRTGHHTHWFWAGQETTSTILER